MVSIGGLITNQRSSIPINQQHPTTKMPSLVTLASIICACCALLTSAAPVVARATCPTTFPATFKISEDKGFFKASGTKIINGGSKQTASYFYINSTYWQGSPAVPILSYADAAGVKYGAFVRRDVSDAILLIPYTTPAFNTDIPVNTVLQSGCTIFPSLWQAKANSITQVCSGGTIFLSTSVLAGCTAVTPKLVT
ncbi:hypothetical protein LTR53_007625 [Teratosphaeriaceae sp. CCFEE 6253]|nr:hypothetical protein LTR53_007625 [Teratosphaeriaceae sp. CCFEE 6253]